MSLTITATENKPCSSGRLKTGLHYPEICAAFRAEFWIWTSCEQIFPPATKLNKTLHSPTGESAGGGQTLTSCFSFTRQLLFKNKSVLQLWELLNNIRSDLSRVLTPHIPAITHLRSTLGGYLQQNKVWALITKKTATQQWKHSLEERKLSM